MNGPMCLGTLIAIYQEQYLFNQKGGETMILTPILNDRRQGMIHWAWLWTLVVIAMSILAR